MPAVSPDYGQSVSFLQRWCPEGPWALTSIPLSKKDISAAFFRPGQERELLAWLEKYGAKTNCYFSVNPVLREFRVKCEREDVAALDWLHVDVDPRPGEDIATEQARALKLLKEFQPAPTCIVFSGGGYQAFWRLREPMRVDGQPALYEEAALYNKQLEITFGADHCHNVDRIMRLPGTVNRPDEKKRKKGRVEALAIVDSWSDGVYDLAQFQKAVEVQTPGLGFTGSTVRVSGNIQRFAKVDDLPEGVSQLAKVVIVQGKDPDNPNKYGSSRSEWLFFACCEMVRAGCTDDQVYAVITDPEFLISASVLDKGSKSEKYAVRQIERAREEAEHPMLRRLNEEYAVIGDVNGRCRVIWEHEILVGDVLRPKISYKSFEDLTNYLLHERVSFQASNGQQTSMPAGKWWLMHPKRRTFKTIVFSPGRDVPGAYNLWKGFAFDARPGSCDLFLRHVRENICSGNDGIYEYVMGWMAQTVQRPAQPGHTALVLRGRQGTGKGVFAKTVGALFGRHFVHVAHASHLVGNFNQHLKDCLLLFADEALFAGDKRHESVLKTLVTEETLIIEKKGADADTSSNFVHVIMASNADWVVPAGFDERRFVVLDVAEGNKQDGRFFGALRKQMDEGGYEALLHHLLVLDTTKFDVRRMPKTKALQDQKIYSFATEEEWWYRKLCDGEVLPGEGWPEHVFMSALSWDFTSYTRAWNTFGRANSTRLGRFLRSAMPESYQCRGQLSGKHTVRMENGEVREVERPRVYAFPPLEVCRGVWDDRFGGPYEWPALKEFEPARKKGKDPLV